MKKRKSLKSAFSHGEFGEEFIQLAKAELPELWGRLSLLEEFWSNNAPGFDERSRIVSMQLGTPRQARRGILRRLLGAISG